MSISLATMGKYGGPAIINNVNDIKFVGGGGGRIEYREKIKPVVIISEVNYDEYENIRVIVTSIEE